MARLPGQISAWARRLYRKAFNRSAWVVVVFVASAVTVWASTIAQPTTSNLVLLDAAVGLAFVAAAAASGGPNAERGWMVAVGVAWPLGVLPAARSLHSALLLVALVAFPAGRVRRPWQFAVGILAIMVGLQALDQLGTAASFACCTVGCAVAWRRHQVSTPYAALSAMGIFGVLSAAWFLARYRPEQFRPSQALLAYEIVLVLIAVGYAIAARADARRRAALEDRLVADAAVPVFGVSRSCSEMYCMIRSFESSLQGLGRTCQEHASSALPMAPLR